MLLNGEYEIQGLISKLQWRTRFKKKAKEFLKDYYLFNSL